MKFNENLNTIIKRFKIKSIFSCVLIVKKCKVLNVENNIKELEYYRYKSGDMII